MCGIFGIWRYDGKRIDQSGVVMAVDTLHHRGPDDEGYLLVNTKTSHMVCCGGPDTDPSLGLPQIGAFSDETFDLAFGFRRLAILDLSPAGHQPMSTPDGRYYMVLNGEIYNYLELRAELEAIGYGFRSHSDTEVLLASYVRWGAKALNRLVGMFAFVIYDREEGGLFLARDFFGIKPLYYTYWKYGFAFASEIKALLRIQSVDRRANPQGLYEYLHFGLTDHGENTLFEDIHQIPAAHYLCINPKDEGKPRPIRYWDIDLAKKIDLSFTEAVAKIRELFLENVRLHMRSDVPVGAALSGGIDSSSIVMAMRRLQGDKLGLNTFSYIAEDPNLNEEKWVDMVGYAAGASICKVHLSPDELLSDLDHLIHIQDEPFGSTSIYAQYRVMRLASQNGIRVMLDGQGADELLAGYRPYLIVKSASLVRQLHWLRACQFVWHLIWNENSQWARLLKETGSYFLPNLIRSQVRRLTGKNVFPSWLKEAWFKARSVRTGPAQRDGGPDMLREELYRSLMQQGLISLLRYEDRNSMAFSIESRVPFLTPEFVSFVFSLPEEYILDSKGTSKFVFRQAMRGIVPDAILKRRDKIGFATPEQKWFQHLQLWAESVLNSDTAKGIAPLDLPSIRREWEKVLYGGRAFDFTVWRCINFIRWTEHFGISF